MLRNVWTPSRVLPDVRSIIVLGMNYYTSPAVPEASPGHGWIARYAWGQDYHTVLGDKLKALVACIRAIEGPDVQARWYVDTGPILERELAWRAGLGMARQKHQPDQPPVSAPGSFWGRFCWIASWSTMPRPQPIAAPARAA